MGIIHQDLKLENILISNAEKGNPRYLDTRIIDFGLSTVLLEGFYSKSKVGTVAFMPPEVLLTREHNQKMDVWALGIILCTMLTGHIPFVSLRSIEQTVQNICCLEMSFHSRCCISVLAKDLILQMLLKEPTQRITVDQVL